MSLKRRQIRDETGTARAILRGGHAECGRSGSPVESLELITALMNRLRDGPGAAWDPEATVSECSPRSSCCATFDPS
jgi:hypothetical protein